MLFKQACNQYNAIIVELGQQAHTAARLFNFTVKNHCLEHIALDSEELSPTKTWAFASESFLGIVRKMVTAATPGSAVSLVHKKVMLNYVRAMLASLQPEWRWL